ncbi:MAG: DivIVA domain-containing protein [Eubacteriales bacterium]|nr:DivIVA domain-containing protein [Eubacteriales bacterium]MDD3881697.1 DivIVA domain-containing protein [Eubacteriales bacterium]MDD4512244.1 DivIVA domain-containing protein [Eubacteriales bacterium]
MALTIEKLVEMIANKEFGKKKLGYDSDEVDSFLDSICDELDAMNAELGSMRAAPAPAAGSQNTAALQQLQQELVNMRERAERAENALRREQQKPAPIAQAQPQAIAKQSYDEGDYGETIKEMLKNTQRVCDETVAQAHVRADAILAEAQAKADEQVAGLKDEKVQLETNIASLKDGVREFRDKVKSMLEEQQAALDLISD